MKACPYRADFYAKLGSPIEAVEEELSKWLAALDKIIQQIEAFYEKVSRVWQWGTVFRRKFTDLEHRRPRRLLLLRIIRATSK